PISNAAFILSLINSFERYLSQSGSTYKSLCSQSGTSGSENIKKSSNNVHLNSDIISFCLILQIPESSKKEIVLSFNISKNLSALDLPNENKLYIFSL